MTAARRYEDAFVFRCLLVAALAAAVWLIMVAPAHAAIIVDRASVGVSGQAIAASSHVSMSADGNYVVFESSDVNLASGGFAGGTNVFLRDRAAGTTTLVSHASGPAVADGPSYSPAISANGQFVVFASDATNLTAVPASGPATYRWTRGSGLVVRVDPADSSPGGSIAGPSLSSDGRFVAFLSADPAMTGVTDGPTQVFRRDMNASASTSGTVVEVSLSDSNHPGDHTSSAPSISATGGLVAFASSSTNMFPPATSGRQVYVRDIARAITTPVTASATGRSDYPVLSGDGRAVAFVSTASDLVPGDTNDIQDVFYCTVSTGALSRVDMTAAGAQTPSGAYAPGIGADGRYVTFQSQAATLAAAATGYYAVYVRDMNASANGLVPLASCASPSGPATDAAGVAIGSTGLGLVGTTGPRYVGFDSDCPDLVAADTNAVRDVFVADRFAPVSAVLSTPKLSTSKPHHNSYFYVSGTVSKDAGKAKVQLVFYRWVKVHGKWAYQSYKSVTTYTAAGKTSYKVKVKLPTVTNWYVRAIHAPDSVHVKSASPVRYFSVRR